ncbi:caspase family protein [Pedobacter endophyticus]|uniref:Caspase family protein n=1 Tax=Pedobacter endophyticus TaxID=2789740 RepID=A0A7U3SQY4_9SPHI|nr:caspase family protein [Pedobacter endophyticus]QPH38891.1 caspase family protein [Pedobacter endophyticus]
MEGVKLFLPIGIDDYQKDPWPVLTNAKADVERLGSILCEKYGFNLLDDYVFDEKATLELIHEEFDKATKSCYEVDELIIYYAGHGNESPSGTGHWIPVDGDDKRYRWISNAAIIDHIKEIKAKHILLISDSCYSGTFVLKQLKLSGINLTMEELTEKRSRVILTSGEVKTVSDGIAGLGTPFNKSLCEILLKNTRPELRLSKLIDSVVRTTSVRSKQIPQACELDCEDNDGGEMIFRLVDKDIRPEIAPEKFPLPPMPDKERLIPRTYTNNEDKDSIAELLFELKNSKIALSEILEHEKLLVLLGAAGSGKSIEALRQAYEFQDGEFLNPIFKRLNSYSGGAIQSFVELDFSDTDSSRMVVFLDGLDEIHPDFFQEATDEIIKLSKDQPLLSIVVTCRTNFYEIAKENTQGTLPGFVCYHIDDINLNDILLFCNDVLHINGDDFLNQARQNLFSDLLTRPFFLNILLGHYLQHGNLSVSRIDILELEISKSLAYKAESSEPEQIEHKEKVFIFLEKISFAMEMIGRNFLSTDELRDIFPNDSDFEFCQSLSVFSLRSDTNQWSFDHNNIQEYFAARVLAKLPFEKLLEVTTLKIGENSSLRPSWINTISFYVSIAKKEQVDELINWLVEHDVEVIIKFEPERLTEELKFKVFKQIFDFYNDRNIWLSSNKFSDEELSRFAHNQESLGYLLNKLDDPNSSKITIYNTLHVLINFDLTLIAGSEEKLREILINRIEKIDNDDTAMIHSLIGTLSHLKLADEKTLEHFVAKFGKSRNQYLRSALYRLLYYTGTAGEHLDIIFDGLGLERMEEGDNDREEINLGDESFNLRLAIESINDPQQLQEFIERITSDNFKRLKLTYDHREIYPKLVQNAIEAFSKNGKLFDAMLGLYIALQGDHNKTILEDISIFFIETDTKRDLILYLWKKADRSEFGWTDLLTTILNEETVHMMIDFYKSKDIGNDDIKAFHEILYRNEYAYPGLLELFEHLFKERTSVELIRPQPSKWPAIEDQRKKEDFLALFSEEKILQGVNKVFDQIGDEVIRKDQLISLWTANYYDEEKSVSQVAFNIIREKIHYFETANRGDVINWVKNPEEFSHFQIKHIHRFLQQDSSLNLDEQQFDFIKKWCSEIGDDPNLLWYFFTVSKIPLDEDQLLRLTKFVNHNRDTKITALGSLEIIAQHIDKAKLIDQLILNLNDGELGLASWSNNAAYVLRAEIKEAYPLIAKKLMDANRDFVNDKELLKFWFEKTQNSQDMREIIEGTKSMDLKWKGIKILMANPEEHQFLKDLLNNFLLRDDVQLADKQEAANFLIQLDEISGFNFLADYMLEKKDPSIDTRFGYRNFDILNSVEAIGKLYSLLHLAKQPEFKRDIFNDLESRVLAAFVSIGIQSEENATIVINALNEFINQYGDEFSNLNFLHYQISRIQEQLKLNSSTSLSLKDAINIYENL